MKFLYKNNHSRTITGLLSALVYLFLLMPAPVSSFANNEDKSGSQEINPQNSEKAHSIAWYKRFQVEFYGSFTTLNPSDLNLFVDYDNSLQEFNYDSLLGYLQSSGQIRSWNKTQEENRWKIKSAFPLGGRLKYHFKNSLAVSIGFRYFSRTRESNIDFQYRRNEIEGEQYTESMVYAPYSLSFEAYVPQVGIHLMKKFKGALIIEGFLSGGPLFVECQYLSDWNYEWYIRETDNFEYLVYQSSGSLTEKGTGTGIAIDLGGRINYPLVKNLRIFLEAGYAYQVVKNVSGSGSEVNGSFSTTWDGQWAIKHERINAPWGELEAELPTSHWPDGADDGKVRNFKLDLSGFQLKLGLAFLF